MKKKGQHIDIIWFFCGWSRVRCHNEYSDE